jgi:hypothetical protein
MLFKVGIIKINACLASLPDDSKGTRSFSTRNGMGIIVAAKLGTTSLQNIVNSQRLRTNKKILPHITYCNMY